jgi:hypothetical protein
MKSAAVLLFATSVAAEYGYGAPSTSSTSSTYGNSTVYSGHGKPSVTVPAHYQPIPTWSTVITDGYGNKITVTKSDEDVTVYHIKTTLTHTTTYTAQGYAKPTGHYGGNSTHTSTKIWNELYEEIYECPYNHVGPHAIPGYSGNPKCTDNPDEQAVTVKEYTHGKWTTYVKTFTYSAPKPLVTSYDAPGTYTIPANDVTIEYPTTVAVEETYHASANKPCTYGGKTTYVTKPTTITAAYAACETKGHVTKTVVYSTTLTCTKPGKYTIHKPTTTVYPHDTTVTYPTVTTYPAGEYHHPAETVTITKSHQHHTCSYSQTSTYPHPTYPTGKPHHTSSSTQPPNPDPSSDYEEPVENYGHAHAGYVRRGGVLERRKADVDSANIVARPVILV